MEGKIIMLDRLKDIFTTINIRHKTNDITEKLEEAQGGGKIYALWLIVLPLLSGIVLGRVASVGLGYALDKFAGNGGLIDKAVTGSHDADNSNEAKRGLDGFLAVNPFHISDRKPEKTPEPVKPSEDVKPKEPPSMLDDVVLRGTLPGVGAWIEKNGKLKLMLINDNIERFRMTSVTYQDATFRRGNDRVTKYITYGPVKTKPKPETPKPAVAAAPKKEEPQNPMGNIVAAAPGSQEGQVPSELVNQLVQNPFDELKRIRLRPSEKAGGLEVQWIQNDSILKRLGVQRGDVVKSVNGIPFTNMGDIANSINSLMNSERFDVEVTRGGQPTNLRYVVR